MHASRDWKSIPESRVRAWMLLLAGLAATLYAAHLARVEVERKELREFAFNCDQVTTRIEQRLEVHRQVLLGAAALFDASDKVNRDEWHAFTQRLQIDRHFQGIQGLGFALLIPPQQLAAHVAEIRGQGFPHYDVHPAGPRDVYTSIIYLEPFSGRNLRAFGYDMYSEPVRRAAMERARDENRATLSGKVTLVQETERDVQAGTLMYLPVYRKQMPVATVAQRRAALQGWVYSPFRMNDLLAGVLQGWNDPAIKHLHLQVYDGPARPAGLLYDTEVAEKKRGHAPRIFELDRTIQFNGHAWTLRFGLVAGSATGVDYSKAWGILVGGFLASLLLYFLAKSYLNTRRNAYRIAATLTEELQRRVDKERELNDRLRLQSTALDASANAIVITDTDARIEWANPAFSKLTGYSLEEAIGHRPSELVKSGKQDLAYYEHLWQTILNGDAWHGELINRRKDGSLYNEEMTITPVADKKGRVTHFIAVKRDVTERSQAEAAMRESERRFHILADHAPVLIWMADVHRMCTWFNKAWLDFTGRSLEQELGNGWAEGVHPDDLRRCMETYVKAFDAREEFSMEYRLRRVDGAYRWIIDRGVPRVDDRGDFLGYIGSCFDITDRHEMEAQVRHLAFYDALTNLPNRRLLADRLHQTLAASKRSGRHGALVFLDLDNFKTLNDTRGHDVGDLLLIEVARRISGCVREVDTVARLGGDEFVVMLGALGGDAETAAQEAGNIAEKIRAALAEPYSLMVWEKEGGEATVEHHCTASIGVVVFDGDARAEDLLKWADVAMYQAKESGRNRIRFYAGRR